LAVLDVDYHHGNGTQDIFWTRGDVFFASLHATPDTEYPYFLGYADETGAGDGAGCNLNLPMPRGTTWPAYAEALEVAIRAIERHGADALVVSLGVDTFEHDPISGFALASADFATLGRRIATMGLPTVLVQEGGYAVAEIGDNVASVLQAFAE
jgi:acetoin utilization deacetylase AcuC-like enzyme